MESGAFIRLAAKALANGAVQVSRMRIEWDISGKCMSPVGRDLHLKPTGERKRFIGWMDKAAYKRQSGVVRLIKPPRDKILPLGYTISLTVKCRQCDHCRKVRRMLWSMRAKSEVQHSSRTWFGTLTLNPTEQFRILTLARDRMNKQGLDYEALDFADQFRLRVAVASPDITRYIKRVRKECAAPLRYLWVSEAHKSGSPHFHALVHEVSPEHLVLHKTLSGQWPHGFTKWKLVQSLSEATYLTKYLSKSTASRVRASVDYGNTTSVIDGVLQLHRDLQEITPTHDDHIGGSCQTF